MSIPNKAIKFLQLMAAICIIAMLIADKYMPETWFFIFTAELWRMVDYIKNNRSE